MKTLFVKLVLGRDDGGGTDCPTLGVGHLDKKSPMMLIREKCYITDMAIGDFKSIVLGSMETTPFHYMSIGVSYVIDEVNKSYLKQ